MVVARIGIAAAGAAGASAAMVHKATRVGRPPRVITRLILWCTPVSCVDADASLRTTPHQRLKLRGSPCGQSTTHSFWGELSMREAPTGPRLVRTCRSESDHHWER